MGIIVMEELCENVVEVRRVSDRMMAVVMVFEDVLRLICGYAPQSRGSLGEKLSFYEVKGEWDVHNVDESSCVLG